MSDTMKMIIEKLQRNNDAIRNKTEEMKAITDTLADAMDKLIKMIDGVECYRADCDFEYVTVLDARIALKAYRITS